MAGTEELWPCRGVTTGPGRSPGWATVGGGRPGLGGGRLVRVRKMENEGSRCSCPNSQLPCSPVCRPAQLQAYSCSVLSSSSSVLGVGGAAGASKLPSRLRHLMVEGSRTLPPLEMKGGRSTPAQEVLKCVVAGRQAGSGSGGSQSLNSRPLCTHQNSGSSTPGANPGPEPSTSSSRAAPRPTQPSPETGLEGQWSGHSLGPFPLPLAPPSPSSMVRGDFCTP